MAGNITITLPSPFTPARVVRMPIDRLGAQDCVCIQGTAKDENNKSARILLAKIIPNNQVPEDPLPLDRETMTFVPASATAIEFTFDLVPEAPLSANLIAVIWAIWRNGDPQVASVPFSTQAAASKMTDCEAAGSSSSG